MKIAYVLCACILAGLLPLVGCGKQKCEVQPSAGTGTLVFTANGEDFVRQGFVDKQGWQITFDKVLVNIADPTAYGEPGAVTLPGSYMVDLAAGDEQADVIEVGRLEEVPAGNYQSLRFNIRRAVEGEYAGSSIVMIGTAERDEITMPFTIRLKEEMDFDGKEGYVGDELKGFVKAGETADVEMTFHFDHIFGDNEAGMDDHINTGSVGFNFFAAAAVDGRVDISQEDLADAEGYTTLCHAFSTLGHLGEGHCECSNQTSLQKD